MASIQEEFSALQLSIISAQTELDKLDRPETTVEELREYENVLRGIMERLKKITAKVKADRSTNKQVWERRVRSISDDYYALKNHFSRISNNKLNLMNREALLSKANDNSTIDIESAMLKENDSLSRSTTMADYYLEMGKNSLTSLYDQKNILKSAKKRILDMANSLGLTGNVINKAMNRSWWDRVLVYSGILLITALLVFVWYYKHKKCDVCYT